MKNIKNKKGFTLIELLAVIVVLAVVLLMGAMAIIPRMNEARKQVFALEANNAIQAAATYFMNNAISGKGDTFPAEDNGTKCVSIDTLIDDGSFDADKGKYTGTITVTKKGNLYLYTISMTNGVIMVTDKGSDGTNNKDVTSSDVLDFVKDTVKAACPGTT